MLFFPTDINLLWDAIRKTIQNNVQLCTAHDLTEWCQNRHLFRTTKKSYRQIQKLKHYICKDETKRQVKQDEIKEAHQAHINQTQRIVQAARRRDLYHKAAQHRHTKKK